MTNSVELELTDSIKKFISVGNQTFLNSKGQTETCRKGLRGEHCKRHHGGSVTTFADARAKLDAFAERTTEKLSNFENGCIWLYSLLMGIPVEEARQRYINSTAMYSLIGVRKPKDNEVKGLQKILLKLADISQITSTRMDKLKRLIKKMTVGNGFSEAGFYSLKDMVKDSTTKLKVGVAGTALGGTLLLTGCSGNPISDKVSSFVYDNKKVDNGTGTDKLTIFEETSDNLGKYTRTYVKLPEGFKDANGRVLQGDELAATEFAVKFTSLEAIDSIALDNATRWDEWKKNVAPNWIDGQYLADILSTSDSTPEGGIIFQNQASSMPNLVRDGGVRVADKRFSQIEVQYDASNAVYYVKMTGSALIYSDDTPAKEWWSAEDKRLFFSQDQPNTDGSLMTEAQKEAEWASIVKSGLNTKTMPDAYKDNAMNASTLQFSVSYSLKKESDGTFKIVGFGNTYTNNTSDIQSGNNEQLGYRNKTTK